jgi:hypothetical protein
MRQGSAGGGRKNGGKEIAKAVEIGAGAGNAEEKAPGTCAGAGTECQADDGNGATCTCRMSRPGKDGVEGYGFRAAEATVFKGTSGTVPEAGANAIDKENAKGNFEGGRDENGVGETFDAPNDSSQGEREKDAESGDFGKVAPGVFEGDGGRNGHSALK